MNPSTAFDATCNEIPNWDWNGASNVVPNFSALTVNMGEGGILNLIFFFSFYM